MNETMNREIMEISVEDIIPNRFQPRLTFDTDALNELANSIREHGIIQPLVVRRLPILSGKSTWTDSQGYMAHPRAQAFVFDAARGLINTINVEAL